jgi:hypothetical protein
MQHILTITSYIHSETVPTLADIRLQLTEDESQKRDFSGSVSTLTEGLAIERSQ